MLSVKTILLRTFKILAIAYVAICILLYFFQEKLIFFPEKIEKENQYSFDTKFTELYIKTNDGHLLNGLLFKADSSKGLIFYLHGNAGSLKSWGTVAKTYTDLQYDVFLLDYPGYGKSEGSIRNEQQFFSDVQSAYDSLKKQYNEPNIIILGYSIGTGPASKLASDNNPKLLILQAPYYSLTDMMHHTFPLVPTFILKYKFDNAANLKKCNAPVIIFHGDKDEVIYYQSSLKLASELGAKVKLIKLKGQGHNGMTDNEDYRNALASILEK